MNEKTDNPETELNRLRWQCRRGMLELDYLLLEFVENQYLALSPEQQTDFKRLLEESDQDLQRWLVGGQTPIDKGYAFLIEALFIQRAENQEV